MTPLGIEASPASHLDPGCGLDGEQQTEDHTLLDLRSPAVEGRARVDDPSQPQTSKSLNLPENLALSLGGTLQSQELLGLGADGLPVFPLLWTMWIERTTYTTAYTFPGILKWFEVKQISTVSHLELAPRNKNFLSARIIPAFVALPCRPPQLGRPPLANFVFQKRNKSQACVMACFVKPMLHQP